MVTPSAPAEPAESVLSVTEITDRIQNLSDADVYRFKQASQYLSCGGARPAADLRHEAIRRALAGTRKCPRGLPIAVFLFGAMRSIAYADRRALLRGPDSALPSEVLNSHTLLDGVDPRTSPEEQLLRSEEIAEMRTRVLSLFEDDLVAHTLVEGLIIGMEGKELQELVGLNDRDFATKRRLVRRRIDKAFPDGWK
jgi:RNA polymerase sigma-70 factor (ECF subfamily)